EPELPLCAMADVEGAPIASRSAIEIITLFMLLPPVAENAIRRPLFRVVADRYALRRNSRSHDNVFLRRVHLARQENPVAKGSLARPVICRHRREYPARNPADIVRIPVPARRASAPGRGQAWCANALFQAPDRRGANSMALSGIRRNFASGLRVRPDCR